MSKHQYLISRYHWKSWGNFIKLSADSVFSFLSIGSKRKTRNWRKTFYNRFIANYTSLNSTRGPQKLLYYTCLLHILVRICFCFEKKKPLLLFFISKKQKLNRKKNVKKIFYGILTFILLLSIYFALA